MSKERFLELLREIERKWQREWYSRNVFSPEPERGKEKFFITVPYPYVSGPPHIGHGRTFTVADIIARFLRMQGLNVLYPIAWHLTGTPIQSIADLIARGDRETIERYRSYVRYYVQDEEKVDDIVRSFADGRKLAEFFARAYEQDFRSIGLSMDFTRQFTTCDPDYSAFIVWQYLKLREKNLITRGKHVVLYAPAEGHAVGEHDIKGGDEIEIKILEFTLVKFRLVDEDSYLVAATLRPETIFGVTNVWVNPDAEYVLAQVNDEKWIVSKEAAWKLQYQDKEVRIMKTLRGADLVGRYVVAPLVERRVPVLPAHFVDPDTATGVVYSVPAHAPYDYAALTELKSNRELAERYKIEDIVRDIEPISIIRSELGELPAPEICRRLGVKTQLDRELLDKATHEVYQAEFYTGVMKENTPLAGLRVPEARERVKDMLSSFKLGDKMYEVEPRRIYTRTGNRVIAAVIRDQWFIDYRSRDWKETAKKYVQEKMLVVPDKYRQQFINTIDWLELRPCARKRGLGTRLPWDPDWIIESLSDSTIYMAFYTIVKKLRESGLSKKLAELLDAAYRGDDDALVKIERFFDYVFLGRGSAQEISSLLGAEPAVIESMRSEFLYWYPVDLRHSAIDLIPSHLTFFIMHHIAIFPPQHWPRAISLNEYVVREGRKMSKSLGNVLELVKIPRLYSADVFRLYVAYAADIENILDWRDKEVDVVASQLERFYNIVNAVISLGRPSRTFTYEELTVLSKVLLVLTDSLADKAAEALRNFRLREYVVNAFFNYMRRVEEYLNLYSHCNIDTEEARYVLWKILDRWIKILQPVIPHLCEEIWHRMGNTTFVSLEKWPPREHFDEYPLRALELAERVIEDIKSIARAREKQPTKVYLYAGPDEILYTVVREITKMLESKKDLREVIRTLIRREEFRKYAQKIPDLVKKVASGVIPRAVMSREEEIKALRDLASYIAVKVGAKEVVVQDALSPSYDPARKAQSALPGKPAIYIED